MQEEIWKDIPEYPGYQVSNFGRVKSFRSGGIILKDAGDSYGYRIVVLCNEKGRKTKTIHRLVALAFIPNPNNKREVDHINTIRTDNRVENLRWVTRKENARNPKSKENYKKTGHIYSALEKRKRPVRQISGGVVIAEYNSIREAERATGVAHQNIASVLRGRSTIAGGFGWEYKK